MALRKPIVTVRSRKPNTKLAPQALPAKPAETPPEPVVEASSAPAEPRGKLGAVIALLRRPGGASVAELMGATGWQAHSIRGAISGTLKKKLGLTVESTKAPSGERRYRIGQEAVDDAA